ncbi:MAG: DUF2459 domain-containing protein [Bacteroidetes bacterium]|nr:DUF2459 domain-containing protein [Bacteroidota bacterium]
MKSFNKILTLFHILWLIPTLNLSLYSSSESSQKLHDVYLIKNRWHTGLIFKVDDLSIKNMEALRLFRNMKYVDIGWGDKDFYQSPKDFDLYLAFKALFIPTESIVRIEGYNYDIEDIISYSDFCIKFQMKEKKLTNLLKFIDSSFARNNQNKLIVTMRKAGSSIFFFKSKYSYHLFETCNKWVAKGMAAAGYDVSPAWIITAENLFEEVKKFGKVIRWNN